MEMYYIALVMDINNDLIVYKWKGRPSWEEADIIKTDGSWNILLRKVCNDLKLGNRSRVLLALSTATDNMIRAIHMFPEVQFIDVAANLNKQKRDMLFSVVKEATGQCFIVNASVMPCGQQWIFLKVYQTFFSTCMGVSPSHACG